MSPAPGPTPPWHQPGPGPGPRPQRPPGRTWALLPLFTCGLATAFVIGYAAIRLRSRTHGFVAASQFVLLITFLAIADYLNSLPDGDWRNQLFMLTWFLGAWVGGTLHAFFLRPMVFPARPYVPPAFVSPMPPPARSMPSHPTPPQSTPPRPAPPRPAPPQGAPSRPAPSPPRRASVAPDSWRTGTVRPGYGARPERIGRYRVVTTLGTGGQGTVYRAVAPNGKEVAVKVLHDRIRGDERDRFMREAAAARRVPSFSTARVLDVGVEGDLGYIVSDYVPGSRSLERRVHEDGPLDADSVVRLAIATSAALAAIHGAGVVHRDFKPANVLLAPDGPRVIDFGVAKALDQVTTTAGLKGTPAYMAPEQISPGRAGPESDVFSWASTMIYAATGRVAFDADTPYNMYRRILEHQPDLSGLPPALLGPVASCLEKDPARRPKAADLMSAITG